MSGKCTEEETKQELPDQALKRLFALDLMRQLAAFLRRQRAASSEAAAVQLPAIAHEPAIQVKTQAHCHNRCPI